MSSRVREKERSKRIIGPAKSERKRKKKKKKKTRSHFLALYYFRNTKRTE